MNDAEIKPTDKVKKLGIYLDQQLAMSDQIDSLCRLLYFELHRIGLVRRFLTIDATKCLMVSLVLSKIDYCNVLLSGLPDEQLKRLQTVQNYAARIIFMKKKTDHVTPLLIRLHWLPIKARIDYKSATIVFKCLHNLAPQYLADLIHLKPNPRSLRSSNDTTILAIEKNKSKSYGDRTFEFFGTKLWNSLPRQLREKDTLQSFKTSLKTFLFEKYLLDVV